MATIINTPGQPSDQGGMAGWIVAIVAIVLLVIAGMYFYPRTQQPATVAPVPQQQQQPTNATPNVYNTTLNATTTVNNSTTTR